MKNVDLNPPLPTTTYQKVAMGTWKHVGDPSIYSLFEVDYSAALDLTNRLNKEYKIKLTPTHFVSQAASLAFKVRPELNALVRNFQIYPRKSVDVFHQVFIPSDKTDTGNKSDLSGTVVRGTEEMSLVDLYRYLKNYVDEVKERRSALVKTQAHVIQKIPRFAMGTFLNLMSFVNYGLNISFAGIPKDPFGSMIISNVGHFGSQGAFIPLVPYSRVGLLLAIGKVQKKPIVKNNEIVVRDILPIYVTADHRYADGFHFATMEKVFKKSLEEPERWLVHAPNNIFLEIKKELL